jgi:hypothetical protein
MPPLTTGPSVVRRRYLEQYQRRMLGRSERLGIQDTLIYHLRNRAEIPGLWTTQLSLFDIIDRVRFS